MPKNEPSKENSAGVAVTAGEAPQDWDDAWRNVRGESGPGRQPCEAERGHGHVQTSMDPASVFFIATSESAVLVLIQWQETMVLRPLTPILMMEGV